MILADKIIYLRKKCGWSQEELAEKMNVSRQSISKWEGAQSVPDLDKILKLCQVFGVSTDYLLKEEIEEPELKEDKYEPLNVKHISAEYANEFMDAKRKSALKVAIGSSICVLSPITLILMSGLEEFGHVAGNVAAAVGLAVLLCMVIVAVVLFIFNGSMMSDYEWLQKEKFVLDYGVSGIIENRKKKQHPMLTLTRAIGVGLCILGAAVLTVTAVLTGEALATIIAVDVLLVLVAMAVFLFVRWGNEADAYEQLLQTGDYDPDHKKNYEKHELIGGIYWCSVTAIYLAISFITNRWDYTWIIWPVTGVAYGVIACILNYAEKKA
ncbi:MAG: helix-turn-helix transcriptional regulator [Lachnospiraceae bacterium]|nr:helix-turn-helix transcriptional regulator [Lachnospiraceae bacterium]